MKSSKPECKNYISEEICAASAKHPEETCHDDEQGDCTSFKDVMLELKPPAKMAKKQ